MKEEKALTPKWAALQEQDRELWPGSSVGWNMVPICQGCGWNNKSVSLSPLSSLSPPPSFSLKLIINLKKHGLERAWGNQITPL